MHNSKVTPQAVFDEYKKGTEYKNSIGDKGISEQNKINERFYIGDQWHGAKCGNARPLVRRNVIKRIADYKLTSVIAAPIAVNYSAEGVADNSFLKDEIASYREKMMSGEKTNQKVSEGEISVVMSVLSDYFRTTAERVKFDLKKEDVLRKAYISGTGIAYTYWDDQIKTGLYADSAKKQPIKGDIAFEVLDVENVVFGDPNCDDLQKQPFIIISQRLFCDDVRRQAKRNLISQAEIENIVPDNQKGYEFSYNESEPTDSERVSVLTKLYKEFDETGENYRIMAVKVCENAVVKRPWDTGLKLYPLAKMSWSPRYGSAYGESEITYQIPNQIAINRALSAEVWATMTTGMPKTIVNGDIVTEPITNNPGEIIKVYGANEDVAGAIRQIAPPDFGEQLITAVNDLAQNTLDDAGATNAALGDIRPDNAAAIIQMRDAALQPIKLYQSRFYDFVEDVARIWADFWLNLYGDRNLKVRNDQGVFYMPFSPQRYEDLIINARVDVGVSPVWSVPATVSMLEGMYLNKIIDRVQYLQRVPDGVIPNKMELIEEIKSAPIPAENQENHSKEQIL